MKITKKAYKQSLGALFLFSCLSFNAANAGIVTIINENTDPVEVRIIPEPLTEMPAYCMKCLGGTQECTYKNKVNLIVPDQALCGNTLFAIKGTTGGFLFNGNCRNLSVHKNYMIRFLNDSVGTTCVSQEI